MIKHIDYTQHSAFKHCPWKWYERYTRGMKHKDRMGQRSDSLALGTLVHAGIEAYYRRGELTIPQTAIDSVTPTPETLQDAMGLVAAYVGTYPREEWETFHHEDPLTFHVRFGAEWMWLGLAKIDSWFMVDKPTRVPDGMGGEFTLTPGPKIREYKTKAANLDRAKWIKSWTANMQASFQILALAHKLKLGNDVLPELYVSVIEKPTVYVPKRKCKACKETYEYGSYVPVGNKFRCRWCGQEQALSPIRTKDQEARKPTFFTFPVCRTVERLERDFYNIQQTTYDMDTFMPSSPVYNDAACVDKIYGECEYYDAHVVAGTEAGEGYVQVDTKGYMGVKI